MFLLVTCCVGPKLRLEPKAETISEQCGVRIGLEVTRMQAICIAIRAGLEEGMAPWSIKEEKHKKTGEKIWIIKNTLEKGEGERGSYGMSITISKFDGQILAIGRWERSSKKIRKEKDRK